MNKLITFKSTTSASHVFIFVVFATFFFLKYIIHICKFICHSNIQSKCFKSEGRGSNDTEGGKNVCVKRGHAKREM